MNIIKLNRSDLAEVVKRTVRSVMNESVSEAMGSIMAGKEDVIREIVDYIKHEWERIQVDNDTPVDSGTFGQGKSNTPVGTYATYKFTVPNKITSQLGIAEYFELNVTIENYVTTPAVIAGFSQGDRNTGGASYGGPEYSQYLKPKMRVFRSKIDLTVPAFNYELQERGLVSAIYHELNHNKTQLMTKINKRDRFSDEQLNNTTLFSMSRRKNENPHFTVARSMRPDPINAWLQNSMYKSYLEQFKALNFLFYGLWETTERNARAEAIYGDLMAFDSKRENFKTDYPKTELYYQIERFKELLAEVSKVPSDTEVWFYAAEVMNMKRNRTQDGRKFYEEVKQRFIKRTNELIDVLYKKGMKVAEYYYQEHEPKKEKSRLEKYKEEHGL